MLWEGKSEPLKSLSKLQHKDWIMTTSLNTASPFSKGKREQRINIKRDLMQNCFSFKHHHSSASTYKQSPISAKGTGPPAQWLSITKLLKPWVETKKKPATVSECNNQKLKCIMNWGVSGSAHLYCGMELHWVLILNTSSRVIPAKTTWNTSVYNRDDCATNYSVLLYKVFYS